VAEHFFLHLYNMLYIHMHLSLSLSLSLCVCVCVCIHIYIHTHTHAQGLLKDEVVAEYIETTFGGAETLIKDILLDFFRSA